MEKGYQLQQWIFVERLGGGGMAEVWKARHTRLEEFVAIKFLLPSFAGNTEAQDRFLREGRSQFILRHPNIVRSSDFITQDDRHFLVMDYIAGRSLYTLAMDEGPLEVARVVQLALPLLDALEHAHEKGIVHRDVKLQNILLDETEKPYLTDFGIAKALHPAGGSSMGRSRTGTRMVLGSAECMSPEQIQHPGDVDERSDIYSFGCVLYDLLTGQPPFMAEGDESEFEIQRRHVFEPPRPLRELNADIPEAIETVVLRALEKDRNKRFASCKEMARALAGQTATGSVVSVPDTAKQPEDPREDQGKEKGATPGSRRRYTPTTIGTLEPPVDPQPSPPITPPPSSTAATPRRWLTSIVVLLLVSLLGFGAYKTFQIYNVQATKPPGPPPLDKIPGPSQDQVELERLRQAEAEAKRIREAQQQKSVDAENELAAKTAEVNRLKREADARDQKAAADKVLADQAAEAERERLRKERDAALERERLVNAQNAQAESDRQRKDAEDRRLAAQNAQAAAQVDRQRKDRDAAAEKDRQRLAAIPPRGTFRWALDLRQGETALIRFAPDGGVFTSSGTFLGGDPFHGVQADVRLTGDSLQLFEVTQPLLPSTDYRQLELRCKRGRCSQTVQVTWTRN